MWWITTTPGNGPGPSGRARYAGITSPPWPSMFTVSASIPSYIERAPRAARMDAFDHTPVWRVHTPGIDSAPCPSTFCSAVARPGGDRRERRAGRPRGRGPHPARALPPRGRRAHRHQHRLRHHHLRRVHGAARRRVGEVVHGARRPGRRQRDHHDRGPGRRRRDAPDAGGVPRAPRSAVRLLHAGHGDGGGVAARRSTARSPKPRCAWGSRATSAAAPATTTS